MHNASMELTKELMGASVAPLILAILKDGESYGYALIQRVRALSSGEIEWTDGMLYPVLHRLEEQQLIESYWKTAENGRKRKYYLMKDSGHKALAIQREQWRLVSQTLNQLWGDSTCSTLSTRFVNGVAEFRFAFQSIVTRLPS
jgi:hypothetical protein